MHTILIVDDMPIFRDPIAASLRLAGYQTLCAASGREAMTAALEHQPDLILLDLAMPQMDGLEFLSCLRANPSLAATPVILLSAISERNSIVQAGLLGVRDYLLKSRFSLEELLNRVKRCIGERSSSPPAATGSSEARAAAATSERPPRLLTREICLQRVQSALEAKTLSGIVAQVISLAASPRGDMGDLAAMIAREPMLSARVLQAANSAAYASRGVVKTIADAVRTIGCSTVRNIAAAFGIFDAMPETAPDGFNPIRCWQHSFGVARICEHLSGESSQEGAGAAYLIGLCHDLGEILFYTRFGKEYRQVLQWHQRSGHNRRELEQDMLGITHGELVLVILRQMGLPESIQRPIEAFFSKNEGSHPQLIARQARLLRLAESYVNGMLLAAGSHALVSPASRSECQRATGQEHPAELDCELLRMEIFGLTGMLARLSPEEESELMVPLFRPTQRKVCLIRDPLLSRFDPVHKALESMASVQVRDRLPSGGESIDAESLVVETASINSPGFAPADIYRAGLPVLWLARREESGVRLGPGTQQPIVGAVPLQRLAEFVQQQNASTPEGSCSCEAA